jgi:hypothetical protein
MNNNSYRWPSLPANSFGERIVSSSGSLNDRLARSLQFYSTSSQTGGGIRAMPWNGDEGGLEHMRRKFNSPLVWTCYLRRSQQAAH